ncbi:MAG: hypothetical protein NT038_09595 [Euryarchaeota archaeon]|nr:hypothetical protein [Euryarchaeota archaeon]
MKNTLFSIVIVMFTFGCSDKITNITEATYVNGFYSCVGTWSGKDVELNPEVEIFRTDGSWEQSYVDHNTGEAFTYKGYYIQNSREITSYYVIRSATYSYQYVMKDSVTIIKLYGRLVSTLNKI